MKLKQILLAIFASASVLQAGPAAGTQTLHGHVPDAVRLGHMHSAGRLAATNRLTLTIGLPLRNQADLGELLHQLYEPGSPEYHHYLTPDEFIDRFGPSESDYQAVAAFAKTNGLTITGAHRARTLIDVSGTASQIENAFHVHLQTYRHPTESRLFYAPDTEPTINLEISVLSVSGLDNYQLPRPLNHQVLATTRPAGARPQAGSAPSGNYMGNDFRAAYVPGVTLTGSGQTLGLMEVNASFYTNDIAAYETQAGLPAVPMQTVLLDGYSGAPGGYLANAEVSLDIELAVSMAPGLAQVTVYEGPNTDDILDEMAVPTHGEPLSRQLSASWLFAITANTEQIFQQFAAQGQSYFNASGDYDAFYPGLGTTSVEADTNITVVGGTTLTTSGPGGSWQSETVWNWGNSVGSSGGITGFGMPAWQQGIDMSTNQGSMTQRNIPDVALTADNVWVVYGNGSSGEFGGTSCATPLWAAFMALVNQQASTYGWAPAGFINPAIYALAKSPAYATYFHDTTAGNNASANSGNHYSATPGYDLCTGWGSPAGQSLINALAPPDYMVITPLNGFTSSGNPGGPFNITSQTLTLTNSGMSPFAWSVVNTSAWLTVTMNGSAPAMTPVPIPLANPDFESPAGSQGTVAGTPDGWTASYTGYWGVFNPNAGLYTNVVNDILPAPASGSQVLWIQGSNFISEFLTNTLTPNQTYMLSGAIGNRGDSSGIWPGDQDSVFLRAGTTILASNVNLTHPAPGSFLPWTISYTAPASGLPADPLEIWLGQNGSGQVHYDNISLTIGGNSATTLIAGGPAATVVVSLSSVASNLVVGTYSATVWFTNQGDSFGESRTFTLTVLGMPAIAVQPQNQLVDAGGTATFTIGASGATPMSYCWQQNGTSLPGATNTTYVLSNTPAAWSGNQFSCVLSNVYGAITSSPALLIVEHPVYSFHGTDGSSPDASLLLAADGNFYGTTTTGGTYNKGTAFKLTPDGTLTTIVSFEGTNGAYPIGNLAQGPDGCLYGTTQNGGFQDDGTVFRLTTNCLFTMVTSFNYQSWYPQAGLILGSDGYIYGVTVSGTVFRLATNGTMTTVAILTNCNPKAALLQGNDGNYYSTTYSGGNNNDGSVFQLKTNGTVTTLYSFDQWDGLRPQAPLVLGSDGNFYGTTSAGGSYNYGTVFKVTTNGVLTTLVTFNYGNGSSPVGGLIQDRNGNFFGTTQSGGDYADGTVFKMTTNGIITTLLNFDGANGTSPQSSLIWGPDGNLYGTAAHGGLTYSTGDSTVGDGTIFKIIIPYPPTVAVWPTNQAILPGQSASFVANATGTQPLGYQWQFQGTNIVTTTGVSCTLTNVALENAGGYCVVVTNNYGCATSAVANLTVLLPSLTTSGNQPVAIFPATAGTNRTLQICTNPAANNWTTVTNLNFWTGLGITNGPPSAFFNVTSGGNPVGGLGIGTYAQLPVVLFNPAGISVTNCCLIISTNLLSGGWTPATNGIPFYGWQITNAPSPVYFRLQ